MVPEGEIQRSLHGWAWIQKAALPFQEWDAIGMYGSPEGPQTVSRSELAALNRFHTFLKSREGNWLHR